MAPQERNNSLTCDDDKNPKNAPQTLQTPTPTEGSSRPQTPDGFFHRLPPTVDIALNYNKNCNESKSAFVNSAYQHDDGDSKSQRQLSIPSIVIKKELDDEDLTSFDDLLPFIGEFGLYQRILFLLMIPFAFFIAFVYFSQIFLTLVPEQHWCDIPELANLTQHQRLALGIPTDEDGNFMQCYQYDVDWSKLLQGGAIPDRPDPSWATKKCDRGYEFNYTDVPYATIATELGWVCDKNDRVATAQAIFFCGSIFGGLVFGWIADKYGRIPALVGTNMVGFVAGLATAFCNAFWQFCLCRFLVGLAFDNCFTMMYILVLEYVGPHWRTFVANMSIAMFFTLATCLLPWIAWFIADWRTLAIVTSAPLAMAIVTPFLIPESAMWLVTQGKTEKALKIINKFEKINKRKIPDNVLYNFQETIKIVEKEEAESGKTYSVLDLFKTPRLRFTVILLVVIWMIISLVFDGHVRNVGSLGLNIFITFTIAAATELPADTFLTLVLDRWGRRWLAFGSLAFSGIFSLFATAVPLGPYSATLAILGRFSVNIAYNIGLQYAAELLPTVVRAQGVAFIHIMGYVASILAPYVVFLGSFYHPLPLMILGTLGIIGGAMCLLLPESMDQDLPQTLQDGEEFGKNQKFWDAPCWKAQEEVEEHPGYYTRRPSITSFRSYTSQKSQMFLRPGIVGLRSGVLRSSTMRSQTSLANGSIRSGRSSRRDSIRASFALRPRTFSIVSTKSNTSRSKVPVQQTLSVNSIS